MSTPVPASLNKSTTGRLIVTSAVGAALRVLGAVSPETADALTLDLFCRPQKPKRTLEPRAPGLVGHRFTVPFGDENIAVWDWGEGPTVLLVHGWNGCAAQMSRFIEPLVRAGYYVVAPDLPAHGASSGRRTNLFEFAEAIALLGRRVGPVHGVIAHSLGAAAAAISLASRQRAPPRCWRTSTGSPVAWTTSTCAAWGHRSGRARWCCTIRRTAKCR